MRSVDSFCMFAAIMQKRLPLNGRQLSIIPVLRDDIAAQTCSRPSSCRTVTLKMCSTWIPRCRCRISSCHLPAPCTNPATTSCRLATDRSFTRNRRPLDVPKMVLGLLTLPNRCYAPIYDIKQTRVILPKPDPALGRNAVPSVSGSARI
jgi:hypothetical protein